MSRQTAGYSILELTVVLAVLAILAAFAAPRYAALRDSVAVRSARTDLVQSILAARQNALATRQNTAAVVDTSSGWVLVRSSGQTLFRHDLTLSYGVRLGSNRDSMVYDARGLGYGATNLSIIVRRGSVVDTIVISRLGRLRW